MRHLTLPAAALVSALALAPSALAVETVNVMFMPDPEINAQGLLERKTITAAGTTIQRTDGLGRVRETVDAQGRTTTMAFDNVGNLLSVRDANGVGYDAIYDTRNRVIKRTDTSGAVTEFEYNKAGLVLRV